MRYPTSPVDSDTGTENPDKDQEYEDIDENKKYINSNFPVLLTLLGISVFFLLVLIVTIYLLLSKKGVLKKFRASLSLYNNNPI
ncbi:unnamed protein product [Orchesella dallaii]|uniref:Uncharacterized protein n=1 Tax=Orchesella dallaii TaxID=48710 RepID=A0ABP1RBK1_9HEXA